MSKCKLTVTSVEKFETACNLANVQIVERVNFGEIEQVVINFKQPFQLIELGKYLMQDIKKPVKKESETGKISQDELNKMTAKNDKKTGKK